MSNYKVSIKIPAYSETDAEMKARALAAIGTLDTKTLIRLGYVVEHDPGKIELAKRFL